MLTKMGRPKKQINQKQFESLCAIQCTQEEICGVLDVCEDTLIDWCKETYKMTFSKVFKEKREMGKASLRRNQWKLAEKNATMGIWLGKQYLKQEDDSDLNKKIKLEKLEIEKRKLELMEKQYQEMDEDIEYVVEEEEYEKKD